MISLLSVSQLGYNKVDPTRQLFLAGDPQTAVSHIGEVVLFLQSVAARFRVHWLFGLWWWFLLTGYIDNMHRLPYRRPSPTLGLAVFYIRRMASGCVISRREGHIRCLA